MEMPKRRSKAMENNNTEENSFLGNTPVEDKTKKSDGHDEEGTSMEMEISKSSSSMDITIQGGHGWLAEPEQTNTLMPSSSAGKDRALIKHPQEDELQSAKAEMGEVKEENERLKLLLSRIVRNYQSLQMHFHGLLQKDEEAKKSMDPSSSARDQSNEQDEETDELVSLSLGRSSSADQPRKDEQMKKTSHFSKNGKGDDEEGLNGAGLALELGCRFEPAADQSTEVVMKNSSSDNSCGDPKEDDPTKIWPPSKTSKTTRSGDDEVSQQTHYLKKARVSVRVRCDAPTMNDGCQWRKYGQKIAKGNPCPRAYYRCTVSPSCPVRKQVQRCADDMSILITTYEGSHNHPLPMSATAMASTTSAAASMLQSHSSTSQQGHTTTAPISASTNLQGLNYSTSTLSQNSRLPQHFYFPNSSISTTNSHPTITLDLTAPSPSHFGRFPAAVFSSNPRYPSTCLNFSSSPSSSLDHNNHTLQLQAPWNNNHTAAGYLNYGNRVLNQVGSALSMGKQSIFQEPNNLYQSYIQNQNPPPPPLPPPPHQQLMLTETIASATKAITSNPKFQSALAAALTSFVGTNNGGSATTGVRENHHQHQSSTSTESASGLKLKWAESLTTNPIYPPSPNGIGCASSCLNKSS